MPEHIQYEDDDLFNPETHREESDVPVKPLWWALAIFIVFAIVTHIVLYFMYYALVKSETKRMDPPQTTIARPANADIPQNQPLLQPFPHMPSATETTASMATPYEHTPVTDLIDMRAAEDRVLKNYGWVDKQTGVVHIPIEQAKALMAARIAATPMRSAISAESPRNAGVPPADPAASSPPPPAPSPVVPTTTGGAHQ